jgi:hypothetical protein
MIADKKQSTFSKINTPELDLRQELLDLFSGVDFENIKFIPVVLRHIRRNNDETRVKCSCFSETSGEGIPNCPYCEGVGFLWDEAIVPSYIYRTRYQGMASNLNSERMGRIEEGYLEMISPYNISIGDLDFVYNLKTDTNGRISLPLTKTSSYIVSYATNMGFDFGKKDFTLAVLKKM